jgi:hypothetical protein
VWFSFLLTPSDQFFTLLFSVFFSFLFRPRWLMLFAGTHSILPAHRSGPRGPYCCCSRGTTLTTGWYALLQVGAVSSLSGEVGRIRGEARCLQDGCAGCGRDMRQSSVFLIDRWIYTGGCAGKPTLNFYWGWVFGNGCFS